MFSNRQKLPFTADGYYLAFVVGLVPRLLLRVVLLADGFVNLVNFVVNLGADPVEVILTYQTEQGVLV